MNTTDESSDPSNTAHSVLSHYAYFPSVQILTQPCPIFPYNEMYR